MATHAQKISYHIELAKKRLLVVKIGGLICSILGIEMKIRK
jgi:hypothetical protein